MQHKNISDIIVLNIYFILGERYLKYIKESTIHAYEAEKKKKECNVDKHLENEISELGNTENTYTMADQSHGNSENLSMMEDPSNEIAEKPSTSSISTGRISSGKLKQYFLYSFNSRIFQFYKIILTYIWCF